ncbi:hypothetical protein GCM10022221_38880 [Actinocorallia aurea]
MREQQSRPGAAHDPAEPGAGLTAGTTAEVLPCVRDDGPTLAPRCPDLVAELRRERDRTAEAITALHTSQAILDTVIAAAPSTPEHSAGTLQRPTPARRPGKVRAGRRDR